LPTSDHPRNPATCPKFKPSAASASGAGALKLWQQHAKRSRPSLLGPSEVVGSKSKRRLHYCMYLYKRAREFRQSSYIPLHPKHDRPNIALSAAQSTQAIICTLAHAREASLTAGRLRCALSESCQFLLVRLKCYSSTVPSPALENKRPLEACRL
jgi:hypothetical protein